MSVRNGEVAPSEARPQMPQRPQKKPSLSQLTIGSGKQFTLSDLQSQPTTEISFQNVGKSPSLSERSSFLATDQTSLQDTYNINNSDAFTIKTSTPTLTIYSDDEDGGDRDDGERSFVSRLEQIISAPNSGMKLDFTQEEQDEIKGAKQFFILSSAGKPIYSMNSDNNNDDEKFIGYGGVIQTVINSFLLDGSQLKSITAGSTRFTFLNQSPIILVAVSKLNEQEPDLLNQLDLLHSFLLSTLSKPHIVRSFQNKEGFDLRRHLGRADLSGLDLLCKEITEFNPGILVGALQSIKLRKATRSKICKVLLQNRSKDVLYGLLVAPGGKLINIMRPRNHTLHTTDLQILFSIVFNQSKSHSDDEELWLPICLPKFNSNGFLYAFVRFVGPVALMLISADKNAFFEMRDISSKIIADLNKRDLFTQINQSINMGLSTVDIPAPLVYHFIYKSKRHLQYVMPTNTDMKNLHKYYLRLYSNVNRANRISVSYIKWSKNGDEMSTNSNNSIAGLAWISPNNEVYLITGSITKKEVLVSSARSIVNWCRKYEERLFVCEGAVF